MNGRFVLSSYSYDPRYVNGIRCRLRSLTYDDLVTFVFTWDQVKGNVGRDFSPIYEKSPREYPPPPVGERVNIAWTILTKKLQLLVFHPCPCLLRQKMVFILHEVDFFWGDPVYPKIIIDLLKQQLTKCVSCIALQEALSSVDCRPFAPLLHHQGMPQLIHWYQLF